MEGITKVIDWMGKSSPAKLFFGFALVVYSLFLFEQFTDHFRLSRLNKAVSVMESIEGTKTYPLLKAQIEVETQRLLIPHPVDHWLLRIACSASPFMLGLLAHLFSKMNWWEFIKVFLLVCLSGGLFALIPDFLPTWKDCLAASLVYWIGAGLAFEDGLSHSGQSRNLV